MAVTYDQLHNFSVKFLNYLEGKFGAGKARDFADKMLKEYGLLDYFGSTKDGKKFIKAPENVKPPTKELLELVLHKALIYVKELHGIGTGGAKEDVEKFLKEFGLLEEFGSVL
jgi:uncharacterized protein YqgQ